MRRSLRLALLAIPVMVLSQIAFLPAVSVHAVDATGQFEMDGNIVQDAPAAPPYDWASLFDSNGAAITPKPATLLDRIFVSDAATPDLTYFGQNKDTQQIGTGAAQEWSCAPVNNPTIKDDIVNAYGAVFKVPAGAPENSGDNVLYLGIERASNNGNSFAGFWLLKDPTVGCSGTANFSGTHTTGDLLILTNFTNGGGTASVDAYQWVGGPAGHLDTTSIASGNVCGVAPGGVAGDDICAISNTATVTSPWSPTSHPASTFTEAAIDLTTVFGAANSSGPCFSNFLAETRSSQSTTATLKDFAGGLLNTCSKPPVATTASGHGAAQLPGTAQHDTATVSGAPTPTGSVTFFLCDPASVSAAGCAAGAGTQVGKAVTLAAGTAQSTPDVTGSTVPNDLTVGTYCWGALYTPDANSLNLYVASYGTDSTNECFTVGKAAPDISTQAGFASGNSDLSSGPVLQDVATFVNMHTDPLSGNPAGETVDFSLYGPFASGVTPVCTGKPLFTTTGTLAGGGSSYTATSGSQAVTAIGTYVWTASYAGDAFNGSAAEACNGTDESTTITTPGLSITKKADNVTVSSGSQVGFVITVANSAAAGTGSATGITLNDPLPAQAGVDWTISPSYTGPGTCGITGSVGSQVLACSFGTMNPGDTASVHVVSPTTSTVTCGPLDNTATLSATNAPGQRASASTNVVCEAVQPVVTPLTGAGGTLPRDAALGLIGLGVALLLGAGLSRRRRLSQGW